MDGLHVDGGGVHRRPCCCVHKSGKSSSKQDAGQVCHTAGVHIQATAAAQSVLLAKAPSLVAVAQSVAEAVVHVQA